MPKLPPEEAARRWAAIGRNRTLTAAAEELGISKSALVEWRRQQTGAQVDPVPDDDLPAEQILEHMAERFDRRLSAVRASKWFQVRMPTSEPVGIMWFGDPHLGSNGCHVPLLRRDVDIAVRTQGMVAANIGDTVDNWGGRLMRLYADNDVSKPTERRLARWFLEESGIPWVLWLDGNHCRMDPGFAAYVRAIGGTAVPMIDWRAQFRLTFPNGREVRVDAAHDHKGHSMWNELHAQERASFMEEPADLYIAGHRHNWAIKQKETPDGRVVTLARCRGYKFIDDHAARHQFFAHQQGASIVTVIDPHAGPVGLVRAFADAEEGADYLAFVRARREV